MANNVLLNIFDHVAALPPTQQTTTATATMGPPQWRSWKISVVVGVVFVAVVVTRYALIAPLFFVAVVVALQNEYCGNANERTQQTNRRGDFRSLLLLLQLVVLFKHTPTRVPVLYTVFQISSLSHTPRCRRFG